MALKSKKWLLAKMLEAIRPSQLTLFKGFDKPYTDYDLFLNKLVDTIKNNKFTITRTQFSSIPKRDKLAVEEQLKHVNMTLIQYILTNCHKGLKYRTFCQKDADKLAVIPDWLSCTEVDDIVDIQRYIVNTTARFSGMVLASKVYTSKDPVFEDVKLDLLKLKLYITYAL